MKRSYVISELSNVGRGKVVDPKAIDKAVKMVKKYKKSQEAFWMGFWVCCLIMLFFKVVSLWTSI